MPALGSIDISLTNTASATREEALSYINALDIFRVVNTVTPRNWRFTMTFDSQGRDHLHIESAPPLESSELLQILDGRLPILYAFDRLVFIKDRCPYVIDPASAKVSPRSTFFRASYDPREHVQGQIKIVGYPRGARPESASEFERFIAESTWFGSVKRCVPDRELRLVLFGHGYTVSPSSLTRQHRDCFSEEVPLYYEGKMIGTLIAVFAHAIRNSLRHSRYGVVPTIPSEKEFWKTVVPNRFTGACLEFSVPELQWYTSRGPNNWRFLSQVTESISQAVLSLQEQPGFRSFLSSVELCHRRQAARRLEERQERLRVRPRLSFGSQTEFVVPASENELVALYMKLEAAGCLPFECNVLEYTSHMDIDALGDFRFDEHETLQRHAPIEFEFMLENYFEHGHLPEQTALIICWDMATETDRTVCYPFQDKPWLAVMQLEQRRVPVILLKYIPAIQ